MFVLGLHTRRPDEAGGAGGREGGKEAASTLRHLRHVTSSSRSGKLFQFIRLLGHEVRNCGTKIARHRQVAHPPPAIATRSTCPGELESGSEADHGPACASPQKPWSA